MNFLKLINLYSREWTLNLNNIFRVATYNILYSKVHKVTKVKERMMEKEFQVQQKQEKLQWQAKQEVQQRMPEGKQETQMQQRIFHLSQQPQTKIRLHILSSNSYQRKKL